MVELNVLYKKVLFLTMYCNKYSKLKLLEFYGRFLGYKCTLWYLHPSDETKAPALHMRKMVLSLPLFSNSRHWSLASARNLN